MSAVRTNLITKSDLVGMVPNFSANINTDGFTHANDFANERLRGLIPTAMWTNLGLVYNASAWSGATAYVVGNYVLYQSRVFISIQNGTNKNPLTETAYWTEKELYSVFRDYLKPFLCWQAYAKYLPFADLFPSQGGVKMHVSLNTEQAPADKLAIAISNAQSTADTYFMNFNKYMGDALNIVDGVTYNFSEDGIRTFKPKLKIKMIK